MCFWVRLLCLLLMGNICAENTPEKLFKNMLFKHKHYLCDPAKDSKTLGTWLGMRSLGNSNQSVPTTDDKSSCKHRRYFSFRTSLCVSPLLS